MTSAQHLGDPDDPEQEAQRAQAQEQQQVAQQIGMATAEADIGATTAKGARDAAEAEGKSLENQKMIAEYPGLEIDRQADTAQKIAQGEKTRQEAIQKSVETAMIIENPDPKPQAII